MRHKTEQMQELAVQNQYETQDGADAGVGRRTRMRHKTEQMQELAEHNQYETQDGADAGVGCTEPV